MPVLAFQLLCPEGEISRGEKILEAILTERPDDPSVNNDLGYLYADQGKQLKQAEKMIRVARNRSRKTAPISTAWAGCF